MNNRISALTEIAEEVAHDTGHWLSVHEEQVNAVIHGVGFVLSLVAAGAIAWMGRGVDIRDAIACGIYAITLTAMYAVSACRMRCSTRRRSTCCGRGIKGWCIC